MKKFLVLALFLLCVLSSCAPDLSPGEKHALGKEADPEILERLESFVKEHDGIYEAQDSNLISLYTWHEESGYLENIAKFSKFAEESDLPVYVAVPPRKMDALASSLPDTFPREHTLRLYALLKNSLAEDAVYVDLLSVLSGKSEFAGHLYFKTDHHWTADGAYLAYREIVKAMGKTPLALEEFKTEEVISEFRGSDFTKKNTSKSLDVVTGIYPDGEYTVEFVQSPYESDENNRKIEGFFDYDKVKSSEPYAVYLGGNSPYVRVKKTGETNETLLVVRDSFANALAPFLAEHFDLVLIDPRFFPTGLSEIAEKENVSAMLILENMGSLTEHTVSFKW